MLWWHGGGYSMDWGGDPLYDGYELCRKDVIVVTGNYRLDIAGMYASKVCLPIQVYRKQTHLHWAVLQTCTLRQSNMFGSM